MAIAQRQHGSGASSWRAAMWGAIILVLVMPAIAMQFTGQVNWGALDFAAAAGLLVGAGVAIELAFRLAQRPAVRIGAAGVIAATVLFLWADAAVGIF